MEFLNKTECHYTWRLFDIDHGSRLGWEHFKMKLEESDFVNGDIDDVERISWQWSLRLTYAYELRHDNIDEAMAQVDDVIASLTTTKIELFARYRTSFLHTARSLKAFLLVDALKSPDDSYEVESLIKGIKPTKDMNAEEKSAILATRADVVGKYGADGTIKSVIFLREAIKLHPDEAEWKLSLVVRLHRKRHFVRSHTIEFEEIEEALRLMKEVLDVPSLPEHDVMCTKYYLAVAYYDFIRNKQIDENIKQYRKLILELCVDIASVSKYPLELAFCAERFQHLEPDEAGKRKGLELIEKLLVLFPLNIGVNTSASNIYMKRGMLEEATRCSRAASELGGYGATWIYLECLVVRKEPFDDRQYFQDALNRFPTLFTNSTCVIAALFYFYIRKDVVRGAEYFKLALEDDPGNRMLNSVYCNWSRTRICPLEIAYNQVTLAIKQDHPLRVSMALRNLKVKIEKLVDTSGFSTERDLLGKFNYKPRNCELERGFDRSSDSASATSSLSWRAK